jgi:hypothetical protein
MSFSLDWKGKSISADVLKAAQSALRDSGEVILDESNKIAPIDEGTLINSGKVTVDKDAVFVSYDTPYAVRQHEDLTQNHPNGRQAKFLERSLQHNTKHIIEYIKDQIEREI